MVFRRNPIARRGALGRFFFRDNALREPSQYNFLNELPFLTQWVGPILGVQFVINGVVVGALGYLMVTEAVTKRQIEDFLIVNDLITYATILDWTQTVDLDLSPIQKHAFWRFDVDEAKRKARLCAFAQCVANLTAPFQFLLAFAIVRRRRRLNPVLNVHAPAGEGTWNVRRYIRYLSTLNK
jgi:hypothetical protein